MGLVSEHPIANVNVDLLPNPARDNVTILAKGLRIASVEIFDILGRSVARVSMNGSWKWNARTASGEKASAGVYIVRVSGRDENGRSVITSKRLVIE